MGLNGAGKTSLLRILTGTDRGRRAARSAFGHGVVPGYYAQEHEGISDGVDVLAHMRAESVADDQALRSLLGMFGLSGAIAFQDAGTLAGGEKTKLALAQLVAGRKNLLLLDEPTNNLDPPSRTAIAQALQDWPGAMVIVSHDAEFVEALAPQRVLLMPDGTLDSLGRGPAGPGGAGLTGDMLCRPPGSCAPTRAQIRRGIVGSNGSSADLAFVNGAVYTVDAARSWAQAVAVKDGRIVAVGTDDDVRSPSVRAPRSSTWRTGCSCPASRTRTCTRSAAASTCSSATCTTSSTARGVPRRDRALRERPSRRRRGSSAADGPWTRSPAARRPRRRSTPIVPDRPRVPAEPGRARRVGELPRARRPAGITKRHARTRRTGRIERDADGEPSGTLHEGAADLVVRRSRPSPPPTNCAEGAARRARRTSIRSGITAWQDAIVDTDEHRATTRRVRCVPPRTSELTARVVGALWWDRHRGLEQIEDLLDAARARTCTVASPRPASRSCRTASARTSRLPCSSPTSMPTGEPTDNRGISFVDPSVLNEAVTSWTRRASRCTSTRLAERAVREALDAIEARPERERPERQPPPPGAHPGRAPRRHPAVPAARRGRERPAALGGPRVADGRPHDPVPRRAPVALAVPVRQPGARRRGAGDGQRLERLQPRPAAGDPRRGEPRDAAGLPAQGRHATTCSCPRSASTLPTALAAFTMGSAYVNHLDDRTGSIEVGKFADLRRDRSQPVRPSGR